MQIRCVAPREVYSKGMKKNLTVLIGIFIIAVVALVVILVWPTSKVMAPTTGGTPTSTSTPSQTGSSPAGIKDLISVASPLPGSGVTSPLVVTGEARGSWYFEASFPVELRDSKGKLLAQAPAQAQGDWMTNNLVPFTVSLGYTAQTPGSKGTLTLKKDNPSGDPARDQSVTVPVVFK